MISFVFHQVVDHGEGASCPHCGAEGRYIYSWEQDGVRYAAMAGCYKRLTGKLSKGDDVRFWELLHEKQSRKKLLNGWEKRALSLRDSAQSGKVTPEWAEAKIRTILSERKQYLARKRY